MKNTIALGFALLSAFAIFFAGIGLCTAAPVKIMPLGDSITYGVNYDGGYRVELFKDFGRDASKVVFVGSQFNGSPNLPTSPTDETHHEGHSGWTIKNAPEINRSGLYESTASWLNIYNPNIVLLLIGTNDINKNYQVSTAPDRLDQLISLIVSTKPNVSLIVGNLPPIDPNNQYASDTNSNTRAIAFNALVPGIVQQHHDVLGQKVYFCDLNSVLTLADLSDGLHPSQNGYNKMGDAWYAAIQAIPEPSVLVLLLGACACLGGAYIFRRHGSASSRPNM